MSTSDLSPLGKIPISSGEPSKLDNFQADLNDVPENPGPSLTLSNVLENVEKIDRSHPVHGSYLGILTRNCSSTFQMTYNALFKALPISMWKRIDTGSPHTTVIRATAAILGGVLYGGSLLACAALKGVLWIPVIAATAAGGGLFGALAFICTMGNKEAAKKGFKFGANIVGGTVGLAASLVAASLVIVKGPLHLLGMLGARLQEVGGLSPEEKEKQKQRGLILYASLWQAIGDSYSLWTLGGESPFHEMRQREKAPKDLQTLLDIGANIYGENIFNDTSNNFEFIMELNYDPEVRKQFNRKEPEKIYTEMLGKSREEFFEDLKSKFS